MSSPTTWPARPTTRRAPRSPPPSTSSPATPGSIVCSLPDGAASEQVARARSWAPTPGPPNTSWTRRPSAWRRPAASTGCSPRPRSATSTRRCPAASPVRAPAHSRSCTPAPTPLCQEAAPVLAALSDRTRRVGEAPGLGQALKLANNFLSAAALARDERGGGLRCGGGAGHGSDARRAQRVERPEPGHDGQVPYARADGPVRRRVRQHAHGERPAPVPGGCRRNVGPPAHSPP